MAKIAFFELEGWEKKIIAESFPNDDLLLFEETLTAEKAKDLEDIETLVIFIYSQINQTILNSMPKLKLICTMSTGYDHIDLTACAEKNITVCNVPTYGDHTVAEHAFALLLAISRKLVPSVEQVRSGDFSPKPSLRGINLFGRTIGVIGTGKIGRNVATIAKGFGMRVVAYDPFPDNALSQIIGFTYVTLPELYAQSNVISIHVPLLPGTKGLIDYDAIAQMRQGVILLNTSRGGIINTQALIQGLGSGKVAAAGLDVLEEEAAIKEEKQLLNRSFQQEVDYKTLAMNHVLVQQPNVIVTPHNAFNSDEALQRIVHTTIENIVSWRESVPRNVIKSK